VLQHTSETPGGRCKSSRTTFDWLILWGKGMGLPLPDIVPNLQPGLPPILSQPTHCLDWLFCASPLDWLFCASPKWALQRCSGWSWLCGLMVMWG
jgi:hypothetical protein